MLLLEIMASTNILIHAVLQLSPFALSDTDNINASGVGVHLKG